MTTFDYIRCHHHDSSSNDKKIVQRQHWSLDQIKEYMCYCQDKLHNLALLKNNQHDYNTMGCIEARVNHQKPSTTVLVKDITSEKEFYCKLNTTQVPCDLHFHVCQRLNYNPNDYQLVFNYSTMGLFQYYVSDIGNLFYLVPK